MTTKEKMEVFAGLIADAKKVIEKEAQSMAGAVAVMNRYFLHFGEKASHLNDAIYELARVAVLKA